MRDETTLTQGGTTMQHGTPAPPLQPPGGLPRWEYQILALPTLDEQQTPRLNRLGLEGWELAGLETRRHPGVRGTIMSYVLVFKRRFA
jgi:hypothetical protein